MTKEEEFIEIIIQSFLEFTKTADKKFDFVEFSNFVRSKKPESLPRADSIRKRLYRLLKKESGVDPDYEEEILSLAFDRLVNNSDKFLSDICKDEGSFTSTLENLILHILGFTSDLKDNQNSLFGLNPTIFTAMKLLDAKQKVIIRFNADFVRLMRSKPAHGFYRKSEEYKGDWKRFKETSKNTIGPARLILLTLLSFGEVQKAYFGQESMKSEPKASLLRLKRNFVSSVFRQVEFLARLKGGSLKLPSIELAD